jgi:16S rRNA (guanine(966)-N(2))-methyltransferase RsmD
MQVIGGKAKGTLLKAPQRQLVRPITSVVKEAIFSILENTVSCWDRVLDLYAGSGALGIEALSRQAEWADFVDRSRKCCDIIKHNLDSARLLDKAHIYCCSANKAVAFLSNNYDIIFMDPPYSDPGVGSLLATIANSKLIGENSTIVVCHANRFPLSSDYAGLCLAKQRHYGDTFVSVYQRGVKL